MTPIFASLALSLSWALAALAPAPNTVTLVFVPDDASHPAAAFVVEEDNSDRSVRWLIEAGGSPAIVGRIADRGQRTSSLVVLPRTPAGAALAERAGGLMLTVQTGTDWQASFASVKTTKRSGPAPIDDATVRLTITEFGDGAVAFLSGTRVEVPGRAVILRRSEPTVAVIAVGGALERALPVAIASAEACGSPVGTAWSAPDALLRLVTVAAPACGQGLALVRVAGVRTDPRRDQPAAGVVLVRSSGGRPSGP